MLRGTRVMQGLVSLTTDGSKLNKELVDSVDAAGDDIERSGEDHGEGYADNFSDGFFSRIKGKFTNRLNKTVDGERIGARAGDEAGESFVDRMTDKVSSLGDKIGAELGDRMASKPEQIRRGIDRAFDDDFADRLGDRIGSRITDSMGEAIDRQSDALRKKVSNAVSGNGKSGIGETIGRMFGAGSRNNFLNLVGRTIGNIVGLVDKAGKLAFVFADGMAKAGEGAGLIARLGGGFGAVGTAIATTAIALPLVLVGLAALTALASVLVSVLSALLAIVVALTATIASALVGALAVAGPLLASFAAAGVLVAAAFTSMTEKQRLYLNEAFQPVKAAFTGIGQIIFTEFTKPLYDGQSAIQVWSANVQKALVPLAGVAEKAASAFAVSGNLITASLSGAGFKRFFDVLGKELPTILLNLSSALGSFLNGVAGMFAAILPYVTQFSQYLAESAKEFTKFANSPKGQNEIKDFVDRAVVSLKSFWGFLKEVGGLLADLFFGKEAQNAGNGMFNGLTAEVKNFREKLEEVDLEKWFERARRFARKVWRALEELSDTIEKLDSDGTLDAVGDGFSALATFLEAVNRGLETASELFSGDFSGALSDLQPIIRTVEGLLGGLSGAIDSLNGKLQALTSNFGGVANLTVPSAPGPELSPFPGGGTAPSTRAVVPSYAAFNATATRMVGRTVNGRGTLEDLIASGNTALNNTYEQYGGYMQDPSDSAGGSGGTPNPQNGSNVGAPGGSGSGKGDKDKWKNPYIAYAQSIIANSITLSDEIRASFREGRRNLRAAIREAQKGFADLLTETGSSFATAVTAAVKSTDVTEIQNSLSSVIDQALAAAKAAVEGAKSDGGAILADARATRDQMVSSADAAVQSAAQRLAGATTRREARAAMAELNQARADYALAVRKGNNLVAEAERSATNLIDAAKASRDRVAAASAILEAQKVFTFENAQALARGVAVGNATLADYASARADVAEKIVAANQRLVDAISLRDTYATQVEDGVRSFGNLITAQAKTVAGIAQALTAGDITDNLRERLDKIRAFNENLRQLLAQGLSQSAYKQIVDAGVEGGSAYADALIAGGQGSISQVNDLVGQIDSAASILGDATSSQLYQAGVDAAQGLLDGLMSLSDQLTAGAVALGDSIAAAIRSALGIASPSRVLRDMMGDVGDGAVLGLNDQRVKVASAAAGLANQIAVSPEVAAYAAQQGTSATDGVSGNSGNSGDQRFRDLIIQTPTTDPRAVAMEAVNEITGRL